MVIIIVHKGCCFNHIIGMPEKDGKEYPLFDYEQDIISILEDNSNTEDIRHKHLWIKKSTGLGISELILRYIEWISLRDDRLQFSHITLVTGPPITYSDPMACDLLLMAIIILYLTHFSVG